MPRQVPTPRTVEIPSAEAVAKERERLQYKKKYNRTLRSTIYALLAVAALARRPDCARATGQAHERSFPILPR